MSEFNLANYKSDIEAISAQHNVPMDKAVNMFVLNLNVMREHFKGASPATNFHTLGQQWSSLPSATRRAQKEALLNGSSTTSTTKSSRINSGRL